MRSWSPSAFMRSGVSTWISAGARSRARRRRRDRLSSDISRTIQISRTLCTIDRLAPALPVGWRDGVRTSRPRPRQAAGGVGGVREGRAATRQGAGQPQDRRAAGGAQRTGRRRAGRRRPPPRRDRPAVARRAADRPAPRRVDARPRRRPCAGTAAPALERLLAPCRAATSHPFAPAFPGARHSAVLVVLAPSPADGAGVEVLLTRRSWEMRTHRGEISFPGGRHRPRRDARPRPPFARPTRRSGSIRRWSPSTASSSTSTPS